MSVQVELRARLQARGDGYWSVALALAALALYATTLCPTVYWYDSAELAAAAALLGVPHPPGYPLYTLLGKLYVMLVPGEPAFAVNLMSAVHGAVCVGLVFVLQRRLGAARIPASCGAVFFGTGPSFWLNCSVAEVYTTGLMLGLGTWLVLLRALNTRSPRLLLVAAGLGGLGFAAHMFVATLGLGYVLLLWHAVQSCEARTRARVRWLALSALCTLAGASLYLYLPLRLSMNPQLRFMEVNTLGSFLWMVSGGAYKSWFLTDYDRLARAFGVLGLLAEQLSDLGLLLALLGMLWLLVKQRAVGLALLLGAGGNLWFFFAYNVHDVEVFFLPTVALLALGIGPALTAVGVALSGKALTRGLGQVTLLIFAAYAALRATLVQREVDHSRDRAAEHYGQQLVSTLPPDAVVLNFAVPAEWKYHAVFAYYFQKVLGQRPDVQVVTGPPELLAGAAAQRDRAGTQPCILEQLVGSPRPVYMYTQIAELEPLLDFAPEGPLMRVRCKR